MRPLPIENNGNDLTPLQKHIIEAYTWMRKNNNTIPDDVLDYMCNASLRFDELYNSTEAIVSDWVGKGSFRTLPKRESCSMQNNKQFNYWSPAGQIVKSELIHNAIEALKKANVNYKP